jgi:hypothetical protein
METNYLPLLLLRWYLSCFPVLPTGTPIQTSLTDLKNQLEFLGIENVNDMFRLFRNTLIHTNDRAAQQGKRHRYFFDYDEFSGINGNIVLGHFLFFLRTIFLRHSQQQRYRNTPSRLTLMDLPPKVRHGMAFNCNVCWFVNPLCCPLVNF